MGLVLMLRGGKPQRGVAKSYTWLILLPEEKCIIFKCLNNLVPKYFTQHFTRNADLHDHATRRSNDLHPPKPKRNMDKRTFKYAGAVYFNCSRNYAKSATSVNSFKKMLTKSFTS